MVRKINESFKVDFIIDILYSFFEENPIYSDISEKNEVVLSYYKISKKGIIASLKSRLNKLGFDLISYSIKEGENLYLLICDSSQKEKIKKLLEYKDNLKEHELVKYSNQYRSLSNSIPVRQYKCDEYSLIQFGNGIWEIFPTEYQNKGDGPIQFNDKTSLDFFIIRYMTGDVSKDQY
jgi:hypothetical protein